MQKNWFSLLFVGVFGLLLWSCKGKNDTPPPAPAGDNTLSAEEKAAGWSLLFDGKTTNGWRTYGKSGIGKSWIISDNALYLDAKAIPEGGFQASDGGDILTSESYQNFELTLEWKISPCGNSGIIYHVVEDTSRYKYAWNTGPEMQVLDVSCTKDTVSPKHDAGALYDLIPASQKAGKPAGEWNKVKLVSNQGKIEHWLNGVKIVSYDMTSPEWPAMVAASKFKDWLDFGRSGQGYLCLQDHGNPVWYKNIKIRKL